MSSETLGLKDTTIGKKAVMAITGFMMLGFVLIHMLGNLQVFLPPHEGVYALDAYAEKLHALGPLLWVARLVLIGAVAGHIWAAISLTKLNRAARGPVGYRVKHDIATSYAAKVMPIGGVVILAFLVYHLLHLTLGVVGPYEEHHVHQNVINGFSNPVVAGMYVVAQLALALHLYHGAWSFLQTVGASHPRYNRLRKIGATGFAAIVAIGNISIPVAIAAGLVS